MIAFLRSCCVLIGLTGMPSSFFSEPKILEDEIFLDHTFDQSNFHQAILRKCRFIRCTFREAQLRQAFLQEVFFEHCTIEQSNFYRAHLENVHFSNCSIQKTLFNHALLSSSSFRHSILFEINFLFMKIQNSAFHHCSFLNTPFIESALNCMPIVALTWDCEKPKPLATILADFLEDMGAIPLKVQGDDPDIDAEELTREISKSLSTIHSNTKSIAQTLLSSPTPQIQAIRNKAREIQSLATSLLLPGGKDIEPLLYGAEKEASTHTERTFVKSLFELALLDEMLRAHKPVLGICRGSQLINVYYGGTLQQEISKRIGLIHPLFPSNLDDENLKKSRDALFASPLFYVLSAHHQSIERLGNGLFLLFHSENQVPEVWMHQRDPCIGVQYHPELGSFLSRYGSFLNDWKSTSNQPDRAFDQRLKNQAYNPKKLFEWLFDLHKE